MADQGPTFSQAELAARATDSLLGPSPFIGLGRQDMLDAWFKVIDQAIRQPASAVLASSGLVLELMRILIGTSELQPDPSDRRFASARFSSSRLYRRSMQAYFAWVKSLNHWLDDLQLDPRNDRRARYTLSLLTDALAPTNTLLGNPDALEKLIKTRGRSGLKGLRHMIDDMRHNHFMPSQVDKSAFRVGGNLACTPGKVVFRNELLELLQYDPQTPTVHALPLLFAPPQINKYYVLDLSPDRSMIRFLVEKGFQVFAISWCNPTAAQRHIGMDDYVQATREAINAVLSITGQERCNMLGVCAGGITTVVTAAYLSAIGDYCINSLTLLVTVLDMKVGDDSTLGLFTTRESIEQARRQSAAAGVLEGSDTARLFSWLRPNDLIWNYWVNNYLLGNDPPAFDVLFWNNDTTRLPARLHSQFLDMYLENPLGTPGPADVAGMPIDLGMIEADVYLLGGTTDHITPWKSNYRSAGLFGGEVTFVLSNSGHVQCMVNPPGNPKSGYMTNASVPPTPEEFLESAESHAGTWWLHWTAWLAERSGRKVAAPRAAGDADYPPLEDAPGSYVHQK
ncbi:MAG TPA: alpha/beta fold hydrolase [Xanthomonadales bacterium]|nr:alpha/beta fold hydrolase [Xanthomonadales bacterium]